MYAIRSYYDRRVRDGYHTLAREHERFRVVPAGGAIDEVAIRIRQVIDPWIGSPR